MTEAENAAYSEVFKAGQLAPSFFQSFSKDIQAQEEYERSYNHYGNDADNALPLDQYSRCGGGQHDTSNSTIASTPYHEYCIREYKIVL